MKKNLIKKSYRADSYFIRPSDSAWVSCDTLCWNAKNLRNYANFIIRQEYIKNNKYLNGFYIQKKLQSENNESYRKFPAKIAQSILMELHENWNSFFKAKKEYFKNPKKFLGKPKMPGYKDSKKGRQCVNFNYQTFSVPWLRNNILKLSSLDFLINLRVFEQIDSDGVITYKSDPNLKEVSIIPYNDGYLLIAKYLDLRKIETIESKFCAGIDLGVNNLAAISTNNQKHINLLINGRPLKSINAFFNKRLSKLRSELDVNKTKRGKKRLQKEIKKLCRKRNFRVKNHLHNVTKMIVSQLVSADITTLIVGKNIGWKPDFDSDNRRSNRLLETF